MSKEMITKSILRDARDLNEKIAGKEISGGEILRRAVAILTKMKIISPPMTKKEFAEFAKTIKWARLKEKNKLVDKF